MPIRKAVTDRFPLLEIIVRCTFYVLDDLFFQRTVVNAIALARYRPLEASRKLRWQEMGFSGQL